MSNNARPREDEANHSDRLRNGIEDDILTGRLSPGDRLDERELAERYEVSRTPVREALLQLSFIGLVTPRPRQGYVVTPLSLSRFVQMIEVMCFTEASAAELASRRISARQRAALQDIQKRAETIVAAGEYQAFADLNWQLHLAIFQASGNSFLEEQARSLRLRLHPYRGLMLRISGRMPVAHAEHAAIVDAICTGNAERAYETMASHLSLDASRLADLATLLPEPGTQWTAEPDGAPSVGHPRERTRT